VDIKTTLLSGGIISSGLMAGLFFGWTVSVIPGLRRVPDETYITTMQNINRAIINPGFIIPFMGIPIVLGGAAVVHFRSGDTRRGWLLAAATLTYVLGVLGVTMGRNVPLNDALDAFDIRSATESALTDRRQNYESPWNSWHYLRTAANVASFALASAAALVAASAD
jgi:uncharacterized membrane protein